MSRKSVTPSSSNTNPTYVLQESFYPDAWRDDSRMGVLLNEFRTRTVNPEHYESKMKFWKDMIHRYCKHKGSAEISISELKQVFKRKGTVPYCLQTVFDDMLNNGQLLSKENFERMPQSTWSGWAVDLLVKRPLSWGMGKMKEKIIGNIQDESQKYISLDTIKQQTETVQNLLRDSNKYNILISKNDLLHLLKPSGISKEGCDLILQNMVGAQTAFLENLSSNKIEDNNKILLKFADPGTKAQPITDIERSIYNLEQIEQELLKIIDQMDRDVADTMALVRNNIRDGKKQLAKSNLKKKHLLEKNLDKKMNVLDNVQTMLTRIHDSQADRNVIEAYKLGANALKKAFADSGITLDSVDDTIAEMKEIIEQQDEMQTMISTPQNTDIDELELEEELSALIDMKLAENNIPIPPPPSMPKMTPSNTNMGTPTIAQLNELDKEIEKRLAALKFDVSTTALDTSSVGGPSGDSKDKGTIIIN